MAPQIRDDVFVEMACRFAKRIGKPFLGHKIPPLPASWAGFDFLRYVPGEVLHDTKIACEMFMKAMIGKGPQGSSYAKWNKDPKHREQAKMRGIFEDIWPENNGQLPWRLTKDDKKELEVKMCSCLWPHYMEPLYYDGASVWTKPNRMWKSRRKFRLLYFILPTQLRGKVPMLHQALLIFVWGMRQLDGQVHSYEMARKLSILPGSRTVKRDDVDNMERDVICGLSLLNGCLPQSHLNPGLKHFVHYGKSTKTHGILRILWMAAFERFVAPCVNIGT